MSDTREPTVFDGRTAAVVTQRAVATVSAKPAVSVVMPLHDKERYVKRALDSVLAQSVVDYEVIVVDDGSTDRSASVVQAYPDPRIHLVSQPNAGAGAARNRGIREARGEWVALLDADDEWHPRFLERMLEAAHRYPSVDAVFSNFWNVAAARAGHAQVPATVTILNDYFLFLQRNPNTGGFTSSSMMARKSSFIAVGGFPEGVRHGEDVDLWFRFAWSVRIAYVPEVLAIYHSECSSTRPIGAEALASPEHWFGTYQRWREIGRVPPASLRATEFLYQRSWLEKARALILDHHQCQAGRAIVLTKCSPRLCGWRAWLGVLGYSGLPVWCLRAFDKLRAVRRRARAGALSP